VRKWADKRLWSIVLHCWTVETKMNKGIGVLVITALFLTSIGLSAAQEPSYIPRIGILLPSPAGVKTNLVSFRQGLKELGYIEGQNIIIEYRIAEPTSGDYSQYAKLASELIKLDVQIIVTASTPAIEAVKKATKTIPIVMAAAADPVGTGLVASLAHPAGNITGLSMRSPEVSGKRLELIKEIAPKAHRVGILWNPASASNQNAFKESQIAAQAIGFQLQSVKIDDPSDFDAGFDSLIKSRTEAFTVIRDSLLLVHLSRFLTFATKHRLPVVYDGREFALAGGLCHIRLTI
jgi:putative ABC transport system substrate-binding protein